MKSIVLIDDDALQLRLLTQQLCRAGCEVDTIATFESAADALAQIEQRRLEPGMLFLDLNMPDMDGIQVLRELARLQCRAGLVLISGEQQRVLESATILAQEHQLQVFGRLRKPCATEDLQQIIDTWRARVQGDGGPTADSARRIYSAEDIERGLAEREFFTVYQPKVRLRDAEVVSLEALVRWRHPRDGLVFPDQFIGEAESGGLIAGLTRQVLDQALRDMAQWQAAGFGWSVAVNVSMDDLMALAFPELVTDLLQRYQVNPSKLILEVTESRLMRNRRDCLDVLTRLSLKRIGLSIDDFGTGHSSLVQLRDLPFDELKIDRSFINGAAHNPELGGIVSGCFTMALQLNMPSVAEGVETFADWGWLRQLGCELAQGYFIGRPMSAADLVGWAGQWTERRADLLGQQPR